MSDARTITLEADLGIAHVESLFQVLKATLEGEEAVTLDASKVEQADTACLQLLYAYLKYQKENGHQVVVSEPSEGLRECCSQLGVAQLLDGS